MDNIDAKLLGALEKNARISLKELARDLNVKTSTIYHRLHKLQETNILERFTIVIDPEKIGLNLNCMVNVRLKKMVIGKLDAMFLESFAKFLSDQFEEVIFCSVGDDNQIHLITTYRDENHLERFKKQIIENPYIDNIDCISLNSIIKGKKIFTFDEKIIDMEDEGTYFDDGEEEIDENEIEENKPNEVFF